VHVCFTILTKGALKKVRLHLILFFIEGILRSPQTAISAASPSSSSYNDVGGYYYHYYCNPTPSHHSPTTTHHHYLSSPPSPLFSFDLLSRFILLNTQFVVLFSCLCSQGSCSDTNTRVWRRALEVALFVHNTPNSDVTTTQRERGVEHRPS
jgi:hypothetical protein